ncbi:hypothetical protein ACLB2K_039858 [Fragaria x ananassa]
MEGAGEEGIDRMEDSKDLQQQSKAFDKLTDRVEDRQLDSTRVQEAMASIAATSEADLEAMRKREKELATVKINPRDVEIIANELELDKLVAERTLREHKDVSIAEYVVVTDDICDAWFSHVWLKVLKMPPQKQEAQPGKEHAMEPNPQFSNPDFKPYNKLQGKVVLVAGVDSGIGRSVCHYFAQEGATVAFTYVKGQEDKDAREMLEMIKQVKTSDAKDPIAVAADLDFDENYKRIVEEVVKAYNCIDILVNNAAEQYKTGSVQDIDEARIERGNPKLLDYTATKGAIVAFVRGLALELVNKGIRVNGVAPGPIWTPASFGEEETAEFGSEVPMQRPGQPCEVAPAYVFLASKVPMLYLLT